MKYITEQEYKQKLKENDLAEKKRAEEVHKIYEETKQHRVFQCQICGRYYEQEKYMSWCEECLAKEIIDIKLECIEIEDENDEDDYDKVIKCITRYGDKLVTKNYHEITMCDEEGKRLLSIGVDYDSKALKLSGDLERKDDNVFIMRKKFQKY